MSKIDHNPTQTAFDFMELLEAAFAKYGKHEISRCGYQFTALPYVFDGWYFAPHYDGLILNIPKPNKPGFKFLEVGSGVGCVISSYCLNNKGKFDRLVAVDINPEAVKNTKINFEKHNINGEVYQSDMFTALNPETDKFDLIYSNLPWFNVTDDFKITKPINLAVADPHFCITEQLFKEAFNYLTPGGRLVIAQSESFGCKDDLESRANKHGLALVKLYEELVDGITNVLYELKRMN